MKYYNLRFPTVDNETELSVVAGSLAMQVRLYWDNGMQEQYDKLVANTRNMYKSEPLYNRITKEIVRVYDYLGYYSSLPDTQAEMEEYINDTSNLIPFAGLNIEVWLLAEAMLTTKALCDEIEKQAEAIEAYLRWHCTITCGSEVIETLVIPEGVVHAADSSFNIRFASNGKDNIGYDDISDVYMIVEVV